ncbi:MAG: hypothetical protein AB1529_07550, partial [Candidatus Micrarchaeota archaeon]
WFLGNLQTLAWGAGGIVSAEKSECGDTLGIELWLEGVGQRMEARRLFAIRRKAEERRFGKATLLAPAGPYYLVRDITPLIQPYAVLVTPAIMNTDTESLVSLLKNVRMLKQGRDPERLREARYDLYSACRGTKVGFVDLFSGERLDILGF